MQTSHNVVARVVALSIFGIFTFSAAALGGMTRASSPELAGVLHIKPGLLPSPSATRGADTQPPACTAQACPFPGASAPLEDEHHDCVTFLDDQGCSYAFTTSSLMPAAWNTPETTLVLEIGQNLVVCEGSHVARLYAQLRRGLIDRVAACTVEAPPGQAALQEDCGFTIAHVRVMPATTWHFDPKNSAFVAEEN